MVIARAYIRTRFATITDQECEEFRRLLRNIPRSRVPVDKKTPRWFVNLVKSTLRQIDLALVAAKNKLAGTLKRSERIESMVSRRVMRGFKLEDEAADRR